MGNPVPYKLLIYQNKWGWIPALIRNLYGLLFEVLLTMEN